MKKLFEKMMKSCTNNKNAKSHPDFPDTQNRLSCMERCTYINDPRWKSKMKSKRKSKSKKTKRKSK